MAIDFSDIQNHFYQKSILQLQQQAIINGYSEGDFRGNGACADRNFSE
ncbi:S-layer homology domain-containing protein [Ancylothrix sp. C2]|nr:S-layer homology domain-containing protein [Ancylothrix sp. D3o]MCT7952011.1 S-layer homology domain-containing protein [Ancylothrix sp. D3o]